MKIVKVGSGEWQKAIKEMMEEPPVVIAGAGISSFHPTCLPTGKQFIQAMLKLVLPDDFVNGLDSEIASELKKSKDPERIIFEVLLSYFPNIARANDIMKKVFSTNVFNPVHEVLANALETGKIAALITPNYEHP